jgi:hypothetical protein
MKFGEITMSHYTKEYSQLVIKHAIARAEFESLSQAYLADFLEIDAPRITRAKQGKYRLGNSQITALLNRFGSPKSDSGIYTEAILCDSFESFFKEHTAVHHAHFHYLLGLWFNNESCKDDIAKKVAPILISRDTNEPAPRKESILFGADEPHISMSKKWLDKQVRKVEFQNWYVLAEDKVNNPHFENGRMYCHLPDLKDGDWSNIGYLSNSHTLFALGYYVKHIDPGYALSKKSDVPVLPIKCTLTPVVVTGKEIAHYLERLDTELFTLPSPVGKGFEGPECKQGYDDKLAPEITGKVSFEKISCVSVSVYLNKNMEYCFKINESKNGSNLEFIIKNVDQLKVFEQYNKLRAFYKLPETDLTELKSNIAEHGGYIPGALVL